MRVAILWNRVHLNTPLEGVCVILPEKRTGVSKKTGLPENLDHHWFRFNFFTKKYDIMRMSAEEVDLAKTELKNLKETRGHTIYHHLLYNPHLPHFDTSKPVYDLNGHELPPGFKETKMNPMLKPTDKIAEVDFTDIVNPQPPMMASGKVNLWV